MKYYIIIAILLITITSIYAITSIQKGPKHDIFFLNKQEISKFLQNDEDKYVSNLSEIDLYARKVSSSKEYINIIKNCGVDLSKQEKEKLIICCKKADEFLKNHTYHNFSCEPISKMKWKIGCTKNYKEYEYEDGFPHTRGDVVFLSNRNINKYIAMSEDNENLINTLIHEKIHVYQKQHSGEMIKLLNNIGYTICDIKVDRKRSNPDTNEIIYMDPASKECMFFSYSSNTPKNLSDVIQSDYTKEHPYEKMAYEIAKSYVDMNMRKYKYI